MISQYDKLEYRVGIWFRYVDVVNGFRRLGHADALWCDLNWIDCLFKTKRYHETKQELIDAIDVAIRLLKHPEYFSGYWHRDALRDAVKTCVDMAGIHRSF